MPVYTYNALNDRGKSTRGVINADSPRAARTKLRQSGLFATDIVEAAQGEAPESRRSLANVTLFSRVSTQDITVMTRQFATLLAANLTVVDALTALIEQADHTTLKRTLIQVRESINEGSSLAAALAQHRRVFSSLLINMVRAGEASGALPLVMLRVADFSERQLDTRKQITAKMYYPLFMVAVGGLILFALLTYVVPTVTTIFEHMRQSLPLPTIILIRVSTFLQKYWWTLALGGLGAIFAFQQYKRTESGRRRIDLFKIRAPLIGKLMLKVAMSRFTRTLGILLHSGITLLDALDIARAVVDNVVLAQAIDTAKADIREGATIAGPLKASGYFPPLVSHMISIGEKTGQLEDMLIRVADSYDNEVRVNVEGLTSLVEPVIIVVMALVVFGIMLAVLLPIFEINTAVR